MISASDRLARGHAQEVCECAVGEDALPCAVRERGVELQDVGVEVLIFLGASKTKPAHLQKVRMGPCPLYVHAYNTKLPLHSSRYNGKCSNSLLEAELARASLTPLDISPEAKYCLYAQVTITSGKSSAWSIRNSQHRTRLVVIRRPRPRSGWSKKGMFGWMATHVQLIVVARQLQITSSVARGANVRECRIDDLRSRVCMPISSCQ